MNKFTLSCLKRTAISYHQVFRLVKITWWKKRLNFMETKSNSAIGRWNHECKRWLQLI